MSTGLARARSKLSQNTEERACRAGAPTRAPTPIRTPWKKSPLPNNNKKLPPPNRTSLTSHSNIPNLISKRVKIKAALDSIATFRPILRFKISNAVSFELLSLCS